MSVQLFHGDCLDIMNEIPSNSIDMVLADPPYGTTHCDWDSCLDLEIMWGHLKRVIKPNGAIVLTAQTPFDKVLGASNLKMLRYEWILEKPAATGFFNAKKMPLKAHENILVFYKKLPTYNPQITHGHPRKTSGRLDIGSEIYGKPVKKTNYDSTSRYPRSIQKFKSDKQKKKLHPTQKPEALMEYLINTYTNSGECVLDFVMGSGTTGVAAKRLNRKFIGIELKKIHFDAATRRIESTTAADRSG